MITNYATLQAAIADYLARDDMSGQIKTAIQLAEAELSRSLDTRSQEQRSRATVTAGSRYITLPTDLRALRGLRVISPNPCVVDFCTPAVLDKTYGDGKTGDVKAYTVVAGELTLGPIPQADTVLELLYGERITALSDTVTTNTILDRHPDAYLHGALKHAHTFLMDEPRAQYHGGLFAQAAAGIRQDIEASRFGTGPLTINSEN